MPDINISIPDWCFYTDVLEPAAYYERLAHMGVAGVEMVEPQRMDAARAAGLNIVNVAAPGMAKGLTRREHHATLLPAIRDTIAHARGNEVGQIIVFSGNRSDDATEDFANLIHGLGHVIPDAEAAGVVLTFEMLNGVDHPGYFADRPEIGWALTQQLPSHAFKLLYDVYHMARVGADIYREPTIHVNAIAHMHAADIPDRSRPIELGEINYRRIVRAARDAGYTGYWGLEFIPRDPVMDELNEAVALFLSFGASG